MRLSRKRVALGAAAIVSLALMVGAVMAQLNVSISNTGTVVGQTKELTISAQTTVEALGVATTLPTCAAAAASTFTDTAVATLSWGTTLQSNTDYETFFCVGNIGTSAGVIHVTVSSTDGATYTVEQCSSGVVGLSFSALDGATIAGAGVVTVRVHMHTPTVALNGQVALNGKISFSFS